MVRAWLVAKRECSREEGLLSSGSKVLPNVLLPRFDHNRADSGDEKRLGQDKVCRWEKTHSLRVTSAPSEHPPQLPTTAVGRKKEGERVSHHMLIACSV